MNSTARNTEKDHLLPNTVNQKDEKAHTAGLNDIAIPHLILKKLKLPKFLLKKKKKQQQQQQQNSIP